MAVNFHAIIINCKSNFFTDFKTLVITDCKIQVIIDSKKHFTMSHHESLSLSLVAVKLTFYWLKINVISKLFNMTNNKICC